MQHYDKFLLESDPFTNDVSTVKYNRIVCVRLDLCAIAQDTRFVLVR